jgi:hypothetical protein
MNTQPKNVKSVVLEVLSDDDARCFITPATPEAAWKTHNGDDYTVVMLLGEVTDNASVRVFGDKAPEIARMIAALPELLKALVSAGDALEWVKDKSPMVCRPALACVRDAVGEATGAIEIWSALDALNALTTNEVEEDES